jgi:hypothetical protein
MAEKIYSADYAQALQTATQSPFLFTLHNAKICTASEPLCESLRLCAFA